MLRAMAERLATATYALSSAPKRFGERLHDLLAQGGRVLVGERALDDWKLTANAIDLPPSPTWSPW